MSINLLNPSIVGVGSNVYSITQGGNTTTGIGNSWATNYRGALVVEDGTSSTGDFDDYCLFCHSADYVAGSGSLQTITKYNFENNGHFFGHPVTKESDQTGDSGHIINIDGVAGNSADNVGGIGTQSSWRRMTNLYYQYNVPSTVMQYEYKTHSSPNSTDPPSFSGKIYFAAGSYRSNIMINAYDATGLLQGASTGNTGTGFLNSITGGQVDWNVGTDWWFKITSLEENSPTDPYTTEKKWVLCKIIDQYNGSWGSDNGKWWSSSGTGSGGIEYVRFSIQVVAGNFNIPCYHSTSGGSYGDSRYPVLGVYNDTSCNAFDDGEKLQIEWFKPETTSNSSDSSSLGNVLTFFWTKEADHNGGYMLSTQKIIEGSYTHITKRFHTDDGWYPRTGGGGFNNLEQNIYPNIPYKVWGWNDGTNPYMKIMNNPNFCHGCTIPGIY